MATQTNGPAIAKGQRLVIAVDGPAGAGKGAVCRAVASRFALAYLETGALYRAVGLLALRQGVVDPGALAVLAGAMPFFCRSDPGGSFYAFIAEEDVTRELRAETVGHAASRVAAMPEVRQALLGFQRRYGGGGDVILDGRDVGTVVWPDADLKVFLTATLEERARRRALELQAAGETVSVAVVSALMVARDARDTGREHAPLVPADDALVIDTTYLSLDRSIDQVERLVAQLKGESSQL